MLVDASKNEQIHVIKGPTKIIQRDNRYRSYARYASTSIPRDSSALGSPFTSRSLDTGRRISSPSLNSDIAPPPPSPSGGRFIGGILGVVNREGGRLDAADTDPELSVSASRSFDGSRPYESRRSGPRICCCRLAYPVAATGTLGGTVNGNAHANGAQNGLDGKKDGGRGRGRTAAAPYTYGPGEAGPSPRSRPASRATSPSSLRTHGHSRQASGAAVPTAGAAQQAAQKILTLATESLDMLRAVTGVFKESLDKADA